ncbi:MAG: hypothetical protein OXH94_10005 [Rhodospirillales bacterium]|nr:hypothetical protein [Rhodospirillales bacterium]
MKLPIFEIVKQAYGFVWAHRAEFWKLAIPAIVIVSISYAVISWGSWVIIGEPQSFGEHLEKTTKPSITDFQSFFWLWLAPMTVFAIVFIIVFCMYSVAWHRLYLVPEEQANAAAAYRWGGRQWRFLFNYVKVVLMMIPPFIFVFAGAALVGVSAGAMVRGGVEFGTVFAIVVAFIVYILIWLAIGWLYAKVSMVFPSTAADAHMSLREGWRLSEDNGWQLLWIIVFVALPVGIVTWSVNYATSFLLHETGGTTPLTGIFLTALIRQFFGFIGTAVGVSALSISYKRLMDAGAAQPAGAAEGMGG